MRVSVSRSARWLIRVRGGELYLWEAGGRVHAATDRPAGETFVERPGDGFGFHVDRTLESPLGVQIGLRPWVRLFAREGARGGALVWRAVAVEKLVPPGGPGTS